MMMMEDPVEGQFLGLDLAQVVGIVPNDNDGYNFGFGLVFEEQVTFSDEVIIPNAEGDQGAVALNQLLTVESEATAGREDIQEALDTQVLKQESDRSDMDADYKAADEAAAEDYNGKFDEATAGRDAIQEALDTQVLKQESDKVASNERLDIIEGGEDVEGSIDNHIKNVIDGSPAALNTLKELSNALGDDEDFANTITNLIGEHSTNDLIAREELAGVFAAADEAIQEALDTQVLKQESDRSDMDADYKAADEAAAEDRGLIRDEMTLNESNRDEAIATAKDDADQAIVDAKALLDVEQAAQNTAIAQVASDLSSYEESSDAALLAEIESTDADFESAATDREAIRTEMSENESNRDGEIATAKDAADQAIVDAKALLDAEQAAQDARLDIIEGGEDVEGSIDNHIKNVIDGSPLALQTLNDLAEALGDDANFAGTITDLVATHATSDAAAREELAGAFAAADEAAAEDYNGKFDEATAGRDAIQEALDTQVLKQESDRFDMDADYKAADNFASDDRELIRGEFAEADEALQIFIGEMNETLSTQISEIENEGVQDADFTKQTVDVGGKAAGEKGQMVIPGKITDSMVVTFVGGLFQHGATCEYDTELDNTTISVVLYADQPEYSPMTVFGVKSFGTE